MTFLMMLSVMLLSMLMMLSSTLNMSRPLICTKLKLPSELASDLRDTLDLGIKRIVVFNAEETELFSLDWSSNSDAIDVKMNWSVLEYKLFFKTLGLFFSSKFEWRFHIASVTKTASKKIGVLICLINEVALYLCKSTLLSCLDWCPFLLLGYV